MNDQTKAFYMKNTFPLVFFGAYGIIFTLLNVFLFSSDEDKGGFIAFCILQFLLYWCFVRTLKLRTLPYIKLSTNNILIRRNFFSYQYDVFDIEQTEIRITTEFVEFTDDHKLRHVANTINVQCFWKNFTDEVRSIREEVKIKGVRADF